MRSKWLIRLVGLLDDSGKLESSVVFRAKHINGKVIDPSPNLGTIRLSHLLMIYT